MAPSVLRQLALVGGAQVLRAEQDLARACRIESAEDIEQRRFAASRGAQQHNNFAAHNFQVDFPQGPHG